MGHLVKTEIYGQGNNLEDSFEVNATSWEGIWEAVESEMDRTGRTPSGMEGFEEGHCVLDPEHDCDEQPQKCRENLKLAVKEWIQAAWENDELKTGSFHFAGPDWSAITFGWDGK
ncbi:hypothetical protein SEA_JUSTBECAUSE_288 [Streptomyces phage JustBecause]|jgi:hypothetical protein|nr:hypothetical protein SEA_JUSTBECAUSE_288 [Streptomyces phage JustBecause]